MPENQQNSEENFVSNDDSLNNNNFNNNNFYPLKNNNNNFLLNNNNNDNFINNFSNYNNNMQNILLNNNLNNKNNIFNNFNQNNNIFFDNKSSNFLIKINNKNSNENKNFQNINNFSLLNNNIFVSLNNNNNDSSFANQNQLNFQDISAINNILQSCEESESVSSAFSASNNKINIIQNSCYYLKYRILSNSEFSNLILYPFLRPKMLILIINHFGTYIYQNLLEVLNKNNLIDFLIFLTNNFDIISHSTNGTRTIQKLIEICSGAKNENNNNNFIYQAFVEMFKNKIVALCIDENANHIIQKFIFNIKFPYNNFVYEEIFNNFIYIALTKYGCCVIQKCLIHGNKEQKEKVIFLILKYTFSLIGAQFGNYVYQSIILLNDVETIKKIIEIIKHKLILLCNEKYSSNVIEKLLEIQNKNLVNNIIEKLSNSEQKIMELITNKYGNYIIQKILSVNNNKHTFNRIIKIIHKNLNQILTLPFGKKLLSKIIIKFPHLQEYFNLKI